MMRKSTINQFVSDDEFQSFKKKQHKKHSSLRDARKTTRTINLKRLDESTKRAWKEAFGVVNEGWDL